MFKDHADMVEKLAKSGEEILVSMDGDKAHLMHMMMGVCGEAGELLDAIKKHIAYDKPLDRENVIEELGDIEFYLEGLRQGIGVERESVIAHNITKLSKRYGSGLFSDDQATDRADKIPLVTKEDVNRLHFNNSSRMLEITARTPDGVLRDFFYSVNELSADNETGAFKFINDMVVDKGYHK